MTRYRVVKMSPHGGNRPHNPVQSAPADHPREPMSTEFEAPGPAGLPTLPPPSPVTPPSNAPSTPFLSSTPFLPSTPAVAQPTAPALAFDAKAMVASQRRKVENPAYGHMPTGTEEGRAAVEAAKKAMRQRRRRNALLARVIGVVVLAALAG